MELTWIHGLSFDKRPWFRFGFHRCLYIQGCFATGGAITVAAFYMFFGKWVIREWYMPLHWGAGWKIDWTSCRGGCYHSGAVLIWTSNPGGGSIRLVPLSHAVDYDFGICGISMSDIAMSSRSCTERHGDFSESVVFHSSYEVSCFLFVFGWALWFCFCCLFVLVAAWLLDGRHLRFRFTLFSCVGMDNLNQ